MSKRESFILHNSFYEPIKALSNENLGQIFRAIFEYQINNKEPELPITLKLAFEFFRNQLEIDGKKYEEKCKGNKENISNYWKKRKEEEAKSKAPKRSNTTVKDGKRSSTNCTDNDNDNDNDNDIIDKSIIKKEELKIPDFIKADLWNEFLTIRKKKKAVNSDLAITRLVNKLQKWHDKGLDTEKILEKSVLGGWSDLYEPDRKGSNANSQSRLAWKN